MITPDHSTSPTSDPRITPAMEDYLKAIYRLQQGEHPVTNQQVAEELGFSGASVSNMQKRLHELKLLEMEPYKGVTLTPAGTAVALEVIRHHRLLELYLAQTLGMDLDAVHDEADRLEHHVSEELESLIAAALGHPQFDPHGEPIPTSGLEVVELSDVSLAAALPCDAAQITRVSDRNPAVVRMLVAAGVIPGIHLTAIRSADNGVVLAISEDGTTIVIPEEAIGAIRVQPIR